MGFDQKKKKKKGTELSPPTYSCYYRYIINLLLIRHKQSKMTLSLYNHLTPHRIKLYSSAKFFVF